VLNGCHFERNIYFHCYVEPELRVETLRRKSNTEGFAISQAFAQFHFKRGRTKTKLGKLAGTLES
jgi:hypothetical protein